MERYSVPITVQLAARLKAAAKGRAEHAPLLMQGDGMPWDDNPGQRYHRESTRSSPPSAPILDATMYCAAAFQSSSECCCKCSDQMVASLHNTSVKMIEKHYSKYITEHQRRHSRHALLSSQGASR